MVAGIAGKGAGEFLRVFELLLPPNVVAAEGQILGPICFPCCSACSRRVCRKPWGRQTQRAFWTGVYDVMTSITRLIMMFAPISAFFGIAFRSEILAFRQTSRFPTCSANRSMKSRRGSTCSPIKVVNI